MDISTTDTATASGAMASLTGTMTWGKAFLAAFTIYLAINRVEYYRKTPKVTAVGFPPIPFFGSWIAAIRFMLRPVELVREDRHKVAEYLKVPDNVLNAQDGANDQQQIQYTMGYGVGLRTYHTSVVRGPVTKEIVPATPKMVDEASLALNDLIGSPKEYTPISLYETISMTVARTSNRVYVGTELCRNQEFLQNAADYAQAVVISAEILRLFPEWMKSVLVQFLPVMKYRRKGLKFLRHYIEDRLNGKVKEDGDKPHDLVQWLIDAAPPVEKTVPQLAERVMALNVASIHTTTMVFTAALYSLAAEPDKYFQPLREEVLENLEGGKITAKTLCNLPKMESFLRESGRFNVAGLMTMQRNARKEFRFSDGTVIPAGAKVGAPSLILHRDPSVYEDPDVFDGFRFCGPQYAGSKETTPVNTTNNFHVFGHGRHPCPGRFFAVHEMKIMFSLLLLRYDFKLAPGTAPKTHFIATMAIPDTNLKVLFKSRGPLARTIG